LAPTAPCVDVDGGAASELIEAAHMPPTKTSLPSHFALSLTCECGFSKSPNRPRFERAISFFSQNFSLFLQAQKFLDFFHTSTTHTL
jgi:hypothetical protein